MRAPKLSSRIAIVGFLSSLSLLVVSNLSAQPGKGFGGWRGAHHPPRNIERFADELGLTEEQVTALRAEQLSTQKKAIELRSQIQISHLELKELMHADTPDENNVNSKVQQIGDLKTKLMQTRIQSRLAARKILTSEQQEKLQDLRQRGPGEAGKDRKGGKRRQGPRRFGGLYDDEDTDVFSVNK